MYGDKNEFQKYGTLDSLTEYTCIKSSYVIIYI